MYQPDFGGKRHGLSTTVLSRMWKRHTLDVLLFCDRERAEATLVKTTVPIFAVKKVQ